MSPAIAVDSSKTKGDSAKIDINNYIFQSEFSSKPVTILKNDDDEKKETTLKKTGELNSVKYFHMLPGFQLIM